MLEAVTNAVADDRGRTSDVPESGESSRSRSQPILVADLARAAAASAEKAVQAVDGQRARERAERSTGTRAEPARPAARSLRFAYGSIRACGPTTAPVKCMPSPAAFAVIGFRSAPAASGCHSPPPVR